MRPFIVAEMGANHGGNRMRALEIVQAAANSGADAIKIQTYNPDQMVDADKVLESGPWAGRKALELYREAHTPREWHAEIFELARARGIIPFASVFHPDDVDFLETLRCPIYKIASFELTDLALIAHAAKTGKPLIMSTGMANELEIGIAVGTAINHGACDITLLRCTSAYPAPVADANLMTMINMRERWGCAVGLSDHTEGSAVAIAATALGADVIEKHFTLDMYRRTLDQAFSMPPGLFKEMVQDCRRAAAALGDIVYGPSPSEAPSVLLRRQSGGMRGGKPALERDSCLLDNTKAEEAATAESGNKAASH